MMVALLVGSAWAQQLSTTPAPRDAGWQHRVERDVAEAKKGGWELVFLGDSITDFWQNRGKTVWDKYYGQYRALNLGISADRTEHVLWRLDKGELDGVNPKLIVVMIGTNNTGHRKLEQESPENTVAGIQAILDRLAQKAPQSKVLLLAIFPRGATPQDSLRVRNDKVNALIRGYADGKRVVFLDFNKEFLEPDGTLTKEMMPDLLHPREKGYDIWAKAVMPVIKETLGR